MTIYLTDEELEEIIEAYRYRNGDGDGYSRLVAKIIWDTLIMKGLINDQD